MSHSLRSGRTNVLGGTGFIWYHCDNSLIGAGHAVTNEEMMR
jgi:hypothetical protein